MLLQASGVGQSLSALYIRLAYPFYIIALHIRLTSQPLFINLFEALIPSHLRDEDLVWEDAIYIDIICMKRPTLLDVCSKKSKYRMSLTNTATIF
jgi:hypothetical protein